MSTKEQQCTVIDALLSIPVTAMLDVHTPNPLGVDSHHWAIGNICHAAAARIAELEAERDAAIRRAEAAEKNVRLLQWTVNDLIAEEGER